MFTEQDQDVAGIDGRCSSQKTRSRARSQARSHGWPDGAGGGGAGGGARDWDGTSVSCH